MDLSNYITDTTGANGKLYKEIDSNISAETRQILEELQFNIIDYKKYTYNNGIQESSALIIAWNKPSANYKDWQMRC